MGIFYNHNDHVRGGADPHAALFTNTENGLSSTFWREFDMTFWLGVTSYSHGLVRGFIGNFWRKCYQTYWKKSPWHSEEICGSNTLGLRLVLQVRAQNFSPPLTTIAGLDGVGL